MKSKCGNFVRLDKDAGEVVAKLIAKNASLQAKIDSLMLEYCPNDMTEEQLTNWAKHQKVKTLCSERECKEMEYCFPNCADRGDWVTGNGNRPTGSIGMDNPCIHRD